jgi:3-keto-5-aminohexanoate cleavage enzyme
VSDKINICVALAGSVTRKGNGRGMTPYIPITPDEMAEDAKRCYDAGASIVHIHTRDPATGGAYGPDQSKENVDAFREISEKTKAKCPIIINLTTGGAPGQTLAQKVAPVSVVKPEMASYTSGSLSYGMFSKTDNKFVLDLAIPMTFSELLWVADEMRENKVKPECEVYAQGMLNNIKIIEHAFVKPIQLQFVMGLPGQVTPATPKDLIRMLDSAKELFDSITWSVCAAGFVEWQLMMLGAMLGAQTVRVGLEDNLYVEPGVLGTNAQMVEKAVRMLRDIGREPRTVEEARKSMNLL